MSAEQKIALLGSKDPRSAQEITEFTQAEIEAMRTALKEAGLNLDLSEHDRISLAATKFRARPDDLRTDRPDDSDRVHAMLAVFGEEEELSDFLKFCYETGKKHGAGRIGENEYTRGRGLQQAAADIIQMVVAQTPEKKQEALLRLNKRVRRGFERKSEIKNDPDVMQIIGERFSNIPKPTSKTASIPPGTLPLLWNYLTTTPNLSFPTSPLSFPT